MDRKKGVYACRRKQAESGDWVCAVRWTFLVHEVLDVRYGIGALDHGGRRFVPEVDRRWVNALKRRSVARSWQQLLATWFQLVCCIYER
jgi:hypothetical protein